MLIDPSCYDSGSAACTNISDTYVPATYRRSLTHLRRRSLHQLLPADDTSDEPVVIRSCYQLYVFLEEYQLLPERKNYTWMAGTQGVKPWSYTEFTKQLNNSICNNGPWNTVVCGYDGGDCCCSTCVKQNATSAFNVDDPELLALADTDNETITFTYDGVTYSFPPDDQPEVVLPGLKNTTGLFCEAPFPTCKDPNAQLLSCPDVALPEYDLVEYPPDTSITSWEQCDARLVGDGVCQPKYNVAACLFDGGDCCPRVS